MSSLSVCFGRFGQGWPAGLAGSSTGGPGSRPFGLGGQVVGAGGGPVAMACRARQLSAQGQSVGRCSTRRRAEDAIRAGSSISWVRRVAQRAFACRFEAAAPAARSKVERDGGECEPGGVGLELPGGCVGERAVLQLGDNLLDDGVVAVGLVRGDGGQSAVGDERVMAPGGEQLVLPGAARGRLLKAGDTAHDEPAVHCWAFLRVGAERGEGRFRRPAPRRPQLALGLVPDCARVLDRGPRACSGIAAIPAFLTAGSIRAVTENKALAA